MFNVLLMTCKLIVLLFSLVSESKVITLSIFDWIWFLKMNKLYNEIANNLVVVKMKVKSTFSLWRYRDHINAAFHLKPANFSVT